MTVNVTDLVDRITLCVEPMRELTLAASVPPTTFERIFEVQPNLQIEDLQDRLEFVRRIRANEYQKVLEVWRLLAPVVWKMYDDMGFKKLREQKLLFEARKQLRKAWKVKYGEKQAGTEQGVDPGSAA